MRKRLLLLLNMRRSWWSFRNCFSTPYASNFTEKNRLQKWKYGINQRIFEPFQRLHVHLHTQVRKVQPSPAQPSSTVAYHGTAPRCSIVQCRSMCQVHIHNTQPTTQLPSLKPWARCLRVRCVVFRISKKISKKKRIDGLKFELFSHELHVQPT